MAYKVNKVDKEKALLNSLNVPSKYHNPDVSSANFSVIITNYNKNNAVTPEKQQTWFMNFIERLKKKSRMHQKILVGSRPTDNSAMNIAFKLMICALKSGYSAKAFNLGFFQKNYESDIGIEYDFIVLYSLNQYSSDYRLDLVRDLLRKLDNSIVIVVCTAPKIGENAMSVLDFNYEYINFHFNGYLQVDEISSV